MAHTTVTITHHRDGWTFTWSGGPYIEVRAEGEPIPVEAIGVWDHGNDRPTITDALDVEAKAAAWLAEVAPFVEGAR